MLHLQPQPRGKMQCVIPWPKQMLHQARYATLSTVQHPLTHRPAWPVRSAAQQMQAHDPDLADQLLAPHVTHIFHGAVRTACGTLLQALLTPQHAATLVSGSLSNIVAALDINAVNNFQSKRLSFLSGELLCN